VLDQTGHTVIPGLVGLHNHTYYSCCGRSVQMSYTGPRLYLAGGVTTIRTAGAQHPYAELNMKRDIEAGAIPGPRVHVSGPYLNGPGVGGNASKLEDEADARRVVAYWAAEGATWLKASGSITRAVLGAAIDEAHRHGIRMTGHLCSVTFREAAALGIDNLEHGLITNSDYIASKEPDVCPPENMFAQADVDLESDEVQATFRDLIAHGVAVTSTLSVYETFVPGRTVDDPRVLDALAPEARDEVLSWRRQLADRNAGLVVLPVLFEKMKRWERMFSDAGGTLVAGVDPWGTGSLPGYGDQRNYELLVEAGFSPEEAIRIMTLNGARLLGEGDLYGSIEPGKRADIVVLRGDPTRTPTDIRNVTLVFRDGIGYDPAKLIADVKGQVGLR
jgi:imidazolonepropionase-like amidohydrolase